MLKKVSFKLNGEKFAVFADSCDELGKFLGLMFKKRDNAKALLFEFKNPNRLRIHSFFVFFPFIAVWISKEGKVIEARKIYPFTFSARPKEKFIKLLEIPINEKYRKETTKFRKMKFFVGD